MNSDQYGNFNLAARCFGGYALIGGLVSLAGWVFGLPRLTDWANSGISMFANTSLAAIFAGAALVIGGSAWRSKAPVQRGFGLLAAIVGGLTLFEHLSGLDLGIDRLLIDPAWGQRAAASPGRMGPPASLSFALIGVALVATAGTSRARRISPFLGIVVSSLSLLSLTGYLFHADPLFSIARVTGIAMQTATFALALGIGVVALTPELEPVRTLADRGAAGVLARGALPFIVALPIVLAWFRTLGEEAGLYDSGMGRALLVLSLIAIQCALAWWFVGVIRSHERAVEDRARQIDELNRRLQGAMAETHHRVKNNLQVIAAMVDLHILDEERSLTAYDLRKLGQHVRSLAVIHDLLTQQARSERGTDTIDTKEVIDRLAPLLQSVVGDRRIDFEIENVQVALRQGTSLAVLVNELVSNSVKHGARQIQVSLTSTNNHATLQIVDDGPGFPDGFDPVKSAKMGMHLVSNVSRFDLQGTLAFANRPDGGANVTVEFPRPSRSPDYSPGRGSTSN